MLKEEQKQVKKHLTNAQKHPTKLSDKDKKMIKEKYQGRFLSITPVGDCQSDAKLESHMNHTLSAY